jgi:peroxiredoxin
VEAYKDPHLINEGTVGLVPVDAMDEWGLNTEPWTFVIDRQGKVRAKFEQFVTDTEILAVLENAF